jgi:hypothetical protein
VSEFAQALALMMEQISPIREAVQGYREQLRRDGWSDAVSEQMAADLHSELVASCFAQVRG